MPLLQQNLPSAFAWGYILKRVRWNDSHKTLGNFAYEIRESRLLIYPIYYIWMGIIVGRISSWLLPCLSTLKSYYSLLIAVLLCSSDMMTTYLLGRQIHLKAIFDISMCHPKVPYHYTFIMTTSRKKSQKFTQTNSKRPSKVKEAGSCFMTERRVSELSHIFLTY